MNHEQKLNVKIKNYKEKHDKLMVVVDQKLVMISQGLNMVKKLLGMV